MTNSLELISRSLSAAVQLHILDQQLELRFVKVSLILVPPYIKVAAGKASAAMST